MAVIRVRKTPKSAFNPQRRPSQLLKDQVTHLEWAVRPAPERQPAERVKSLKSSLPAGAAQRPRAFAPEPPQTEAEAAARIAALTTNLITQWAGRYGQPLPAHVAPPGAAPRPSAGAEKKRGSPAAAPTARARRKR